jgi:molecular chaperone GrpE
MEESSVSENDLNSLSSRPEARSGDKAADGAMPSRSADHQAAAGQSPTVDSQSAADILMGEEELNRQLSELRGELEEVKDRSLRAQAELENYRKRVARQMEEERRYASFPLLADLLSVWDNTARAIEAAEKTPDVAKLLEGFKMVAGQLERVLATHHCKRIEALHQPFDPHRHQAISQQPSAEFPPNTVLLVAQEGFLFHDRVIRPSQVIVSSAPPAPAEVPPAGADP